MRLVVVIILATVALLMSGARAEAQGKCLTREEAITLIAYKADVERAGRIDKTLVWAIADRESGLQMCDPRGRVKVSPTNDHSLLQMNPGGPWSNCSLNPYCRRLDLISDPYLQIDVMFNYAEVYGDLCPWNPAGNYLPGCGYGTTVRSEPGRRGEATVNAEGQGDSLQTGDGPGLPH